jgi:hypothetical protein
MDSKTVGSISAALALLLAAAAALGQVPSSQHVVLVIRRHLPRVNQYRLAEVLST